MSIATSLPAGFGTESFEAFLDARREPDWLTRLRRSAWSDFEQLGWPDRRDEEWIRTDIRLFKLGRFSLPAQRPTGPCPAGALAEGVELAGGTASLNGFAAAQRSIQPWLRVGLFSANCTNCCVTMKRCCGLT